MVNMKTKVDGKGNEIGNGEFHVNYHIFEFDNGQIETRVSKSDTTESVYVYYSFKTERVTVRFSNHENNATKFGDQLNGMWATRDEVLFHLGLKKRVFIPLVRKNIGSMTVKKVEMKNYEVADLTIQEMYELPVGTDISMFKGKLAKNSNRLIFSDVVSETVETRPDAFGNSVQIGKFIYQ